MWGAGNTSPTVSDGNIAVHPPDSPLKSDGKCENKDQLTNYMELMLEDQLKLKKTEKEVQGHMDKLTKIKSKVKAIRRNIDSTTSDLTKIDEQRLDADEMKDANTPKARTHLLQEKLVENRRIFEQRNRELNASQRAVEETVQAVRQQINESDSSVEKEKKYKELNEKVIELQSTVLDLQDILKEEDLMIDAKTRAVTLMSKDLSKGGELNTFNELERTKHEMTAMQQNFISVELSLKKKIEYLLKQLAEQDLKLQKTFYDDKTNFELYSEKDEIDRVSENSVVNKDKNSNLVEEIQELRREKEESHAIIESLQEKLKLNENSVKCLDVIEENKSLKIALDKTMKIIEELRENSSKNPHDIAEIARLKSELDESKGTMMKLSVRHKSKQRYFQRCRENSQTVLDKNMELINLGNKVLLLEEEKATNQELLRKFNECETQATKQREEIQSLIGSIAQLENQKFDLIQEVHKIRQELSSVENEYAESESQRVTAELKIVELEEQLEYLSKFNHGVLKSVDKENIFDSTSNEQHEWEKKIQVLKQQLLAFKQEKIDLLKRLEDLDKKSSANGSTESFERIMETNDNTTEIVMSLNEKVKNLTEENLELVMKLTKFQEKQIETENLRKNIEDLKSKNNNMREKLDNCLDTSVLILLQNEISELKQLNERTQKNSENVKDTLRESIFTLELRMTEAESTISNQRDAIESSKMIINEKTQLNEKIETEKSRIITELEATKNKLTYIIDKNKEARVFLEQTFNMEMEKLEVDRKSREKLIESLGREVNTLRESLAMNKNLIEQCSTEQTSNKIVISNALIENEELSMKNTNMVRELSDMKAQHKLLVKDFQSLEATNLQLIDQVNCKHRSMAELERELVEVKDQYSTDINSLEKSKIALIAEVEEKENEIYTNSAIIQHIRENLSSCEIENEKLEKAIERLNIASNASQINISIFSDEIEALEAGLRQSNEDIVKKYEGMLINTQQLDSKIEQREKYDNKLQNNLYNLTIQIKHLQWIMFMMEDMIANILKDKDGLESKFQLEISQNRISQSVFEELKREIDELRFIKATENETMSIALRDRENLERRLLEEIDKSQNIQLALENLDIEMKELQLQIIAKEETIAIIMSEKNNLQQKYQEQLNKNQETELVISKLRTQVNNYELTVANLSKTKGDLEYMLQQEMNQTHDNELVIKKLRSEMLDQLRHLTDLKQELTDAYCHMEQLKVKHTEDVVMLNERMKILISDLSLKIRECDELRLDLVEKNTIIAENFTEEVKTLMEQRILSLTNDLEAANNNIQTQTQKMKVIAANLKKKTSQCHDLENKLVETQEKWQTESQEKDKLSVKLEEMTTEILGKDKLIFELEANIETIINDKESAITSLSSRLAESELNLRNCEGEIESLKLERDAIISESLAFEQRNLKELNGKNLELDETKEKARELGVRMQVMETEYIEQLNAIQQLKTDNGLLLSQQAQLNERLENTEIQLTHCSNHLEYRRSEDDEEILRKTVRDMDAINYRIQLEEKLKKFQEKMIQLEESNLKYLEQISKLEISVVNIETPEKIKILEVGSLNKDREILFDGSRSFRVTSDQDPSVDEDISNPKKLIIDHKIVRDNLEDENHRLKQDLMLLKVKFNDGAVKKDKSEESLTYLITNQSQDETELHGDDETWDWSAQEAEMASGVGLTPFCPMEITQMLAKITELEDTIKYMEREKLTMVDELSKLQIKQGKLIKKLREFKIQNNGLQQQLKFQMSSGDLCDLNSAIEEELRNQIKQLEKQVTELKVENGKITTERECYKRIKILTAASDRSMEMKERQDADLELLLIKNAELRAEIENVTKNVTEELLEKCDKETSTVEIKGQNDGCLQCRNTLTELQENLEMLTVENEGLRQLVEKERIEIAFKENEIEKLKSQTKEMQINFFGMLEKSHHLEKECLEDLNVSNEKKVLSEQNNEHLLNDAYTKIEELQTKLEQKTSEIHIVKNDQEACYLQLKEKNQEQAQVNRKIEELESSFDATLLENASQKQILNEKIMNSHQNLNEKNEELMYLQREFEKTKMNYREGLFNKQSEIEALKNSLINSDQTLSERELELAEIRQNLVEVQHSFEEKLDGKQSTIQILEENLSSTYQKLNDKIDKLAQIQLEFQESKLHFEQELRTKESEIYRLKNDLTVLGGNLNAKTSDMLVLAEQGSESLANCEDKLKQSIIPDEMSQSILTDQDTELYSIHKQLLNVSNERGKWQQSYVEAELKLAEITENIATVTELLNVRVQEVSDLKQYIQKLEFDKRDLETCYVNIEELNRCLIIKDEEISLKTSRFQMQLEERSLLITSLRSEIIQLNSQLEKQLLQLENQTQEIKSLKEDINDREVVINTIKSELLAKDEKIWKIESQISDSYNEIQRLNMMIDKLEQSFKSTCQNSKEKVSEVISENEGTQKMIVKLNEDHKIALEDLKCQLSVKEEEIEDLKYILDKNTYPAMIQEFQDKINRLYDEKLNLESSLLLDSKGLVRRQGQTIVCPTTDDSKLKNTRDTSELDVALYMLHQRDVRCEELTHELMQLLEERDTLQLRLSNAIRLNEELRGFVPPSVADYSQKESTLSKNERQTKSSIETGESKHTLNQKLSQLHNVGHRKDVRLIDERELRHIQQMSLIAHKDALSTLPPDAAARLISAKYTLSRDVQSQPSVLLNWLWGKSTPKIVHM